MHKKKIDAKLSNVDGGAEVVFHGESEPLSLEMRHFMHCVETRAKPLSDGQNGLEVVRVLERAEALLRQQR